MIYLNSGSADRNLGHLVRIYFKMDAHHIQFNVVSADLQNEIIRRTEHLGF